MSAKEALKTASNRAIRKMATDDLVRNRITKKITRAASKSIRKYSRKLTATQIDETSVQLTRIPKEKYIPARKATRNH